MAEYKGIDVSEYQGVIDWARVKDSGKDFAILRCGYGRNADQKDTRFEENYKNAKRVGINVGAYLFSYAVTPEQARAEAENCLSFIQGKQFEYPIVYDVETAAQKKLGKAKLSALIEAFCEILEKNGYYVSVYANLDFLNNYLDETVRTRYDIWLAQWAPKPTYRGQFGMWQYSANGTVDGIRGAVDLDIAYKDYPAIMRANGLNGYKKDGEVPSPPSRPNLYTGKEIYLNQAKLYTSSTTRYASGRINGTYYLYSVPAVNGRYRITNRPSKVGKKPTWLFVTGWIDGSEIT